MSTRELAELPFPQSARIWLDSRKNINDSKHSTKFMYLCYIKALEKFFGDRKLSECASELRPRRANIPQQINLRTPHLLAIDSAFTQG